MTVYLVSNNGKLNYESGLLIYSDYLGNKTKLIPQKLSQVVVIGRLQLTGSAINTIVYNKVEVSFLHKNGKFNGKIVFEDSKNTFLRHKQHQVYDNEEKRLSIAKDIVRGKIHNQLFFAQRICRKFNNNNDLLVHANNIKKGMLCVNNSNSVNELIGIEGQASKEYYYIFGKNILPKWAVFNGRTKNPPRDQVNSVLSFLYTLLAIRVDSIIVSNGLDNSIGTLHSLSYGRKSLVFDLIEEYRTPIVDTLTCSLFNLGTLEESDFRVGAKNEVENVDDSEKLIALKTDTKIGVYLTEKGMKKVASAFEKKIKAEHLYLEKNKRLEYNQIFKEQVLLYKSVINSNRDHYLSLVVK